MSPAPVASPAPATSSIIEAHPSVGFVYPSTGKATLCDKLFIEWFYSGPVGAEYEINLYITNEGLVTNNVTSLPTPTGSASSTVHLTSATGTAATTSRTRSGNDILTPSSTGTTSSVNTSIQGDSFTADLGGRSLEKRSTSVLIASGLSPASGSVTWGSTAVPPGMYVIAASFPHSQYSYTLRSLPFVVAGSDNTSCLGTASTTSIAVGTATPASGGSKSHAGSIAGGVVGGLAALAALIAALLYMRYKNRNKRRADTSRFAEGTRNRPWGRLGNVDLLPNLGGATEHWRDRKPRPRSFSNDVKSPTAFNFGDSISPTQRDGPESLSNANAAPTFIRAPPASHDPFADNAGTDTPAYPSGTSGALPDEDAAAIRSQNDSPPSGSPLRQQRKPAPEYVGSADDHTPSQTSSGQEMHYILPDPPQRTL